MTANFYGYVALLESAPRPEELAGLAARVAETRLPEIEKYDYRLSESLPESFPQMSGRELLRRKALSSTAIFLLVYPASTGRHTPNGSLTR